MLKLKKQVEKNVFCLKSPLSVSSITLAQIEETIPFRPS